MSLSVAPRALRRTLLAGVVLAAAGTSGLIAQDAHAAFTLRACDGSSDVRGQGASFQQGAQVYFKSVFERSNGCSGTPTGPTYTANGSGNGIASAGGGGGNAQLLCAGSCAIPLPAGQRDPSVSFQATDEPPTPTQQAAMNTGLPGEADDALIHVIPVATGANALILHAPEGCNLSTVTNKTNGRDGALGGADTGDNAADHTQRIRLDNTLVEAAFAGVAQTWGDIAPGISGTATNAQQTERDCARVPVKRIVRQDVSGTTYGWKAYLNLINPARGWLTTYSTPNNLTWPAVGGTSTATPTPVSGTGQPTFCPETGNKLCSGPASGNGSLTDQVNITDGSIGYSDLATARAKGFTINASADRQDYTFWAPLQNNPGGTPTGYAEPTVDPAAHSGAVGGRGANCQNVTVANIPTPANSPRGDPTLGDWSRVFAAGGPVYGACVLTYILAWHDNAAVYGNNDVQQAKARTVKDYLQRAILSSFGQAFTNVDYSALPNPAGAPLLDYARAAADSIDWGTTAGGGTPPPSDGGGTPPPPARSGGGGTPPTPPSSPSNQFSIPSSKTSPTAIVFSLQLPGAGALKVDATTKVGKKTIKVSSASATPRGAGRVTLTLRLSAAAKKALSRSKTKKISVAVKFTYQPTGGTARTVTKTVTVRAARKPAKRKKTASR